MKNNLTKGILLFLVTNKLIYDGYLTKKMTFAEEKILEYHIEGYFKGSKEILGEEMISKSFIKGFAKGLKDSWEEK